MGPANRKKPSEKSLAERREAKKLSMRRAREKLKSNTEKYDEAKKKDRERKKEQRKNIDEMTDREKRKVRKQWKACSQKYRNKKKLCRDFLNSLDENTPPSSPVQFNHQPQNIHVINPNPSNSRLSSGKKIRRKNKEKLKRELKSLQEENKKLQKKVNKYRKRLQRAKVNEATDQSPRKKVAKMLKGQKFSNEVKRSLIFAEVLKKQVKNNYLAETKHKNKFNFATVLTGKIVKKYRLATRIATMTSSRVVQLPDKKLSARSLIYKIKLKKDITEFFEQDEVSRQCPGKKDTVTRGKIKMQKRFLNDSLKNLHLKFVSCYEDHNKISYSLFCKMRPFWVLIPNCQDRETCLCHLHTNFSLIVMKLHKVGIINERVPDDVLKSITCNGKLEEKCLERRCNGCKKKIITYLNYDKTDSIEFQQWIKIEKTIQIKGQIKLCKKTTKEKFNCNKSDLVMKFENLLEKYATHVCNIKHQYSAIRHIKKNLKTNEVLLHVDFSENYSCKFGEEIQSYHFGGSRQQISLHTSVLYYRPNYSDDISTKSFCTMSENCRHDSLAICAHLKPIFAEIKNIVPNLEVMHFFSDGPTNQYRNRKMFVIASKLFTEMLNVKVLHWHYSEAGHGKGAPDGIGGCLKRQADKIVAQGVDIPNVDILLANLRETCKGVILIQISEEEISQFDSFDTPLPTFKGTMKVHEIKWCLKNEDEIEARRLTCISCYDNKDSNDKQCPHYSIGSINLKDSYDQEKELPNKELDDFNEQPGSSEKNQNKMARKCSLRQGRKLHYSEVYSDDSDLEGTHLKVKLHDFVVTKITSEKKNIHYYVGMVVKKFNHEFVIRFLKKRTANLFVFPEKEDISHVELSEIVAVLNPPVVNKRGRYHFNGLQKYDISA